MPQLYLASSLKNFRVNYIIGRILKARGISCFLPQYDALEKSLMNGEKGNLESSRRIRDLNVKGIIDAEVVLAVARFLGADSAWECGFASGLGKRVILLRSPGDQVEEVYMLFHSVQGIIRVPKYDSKELVRAINSFDFRLARAKRK